MIYNLKPGTWWIYRGPGEGKSLRHMVTSASRETRTITTFSDPGQEPQDIPGWSWIGSVKEFVGHFRPED